ncbi:MAG: hypothetical protein R6V40_01480 [Candidatus Moraniibacteriota bacterium]
MEKKKKKWLIVVIILLIALGLFFSRTLFRNSNVSQEAAPIEQNPPKEAELTPEQALKELETDDSLGENVELKIASPEEEVFMPQQARLWRGEFSGIESDDSFMTKCHWKYYLKQDNEEEELYKEFEKDSRTAKSRPITCGFTSTFIGKSGELRAVLEVKVKNSKGEISEEYKAEKRYIVK